MVSVPEGIFGIGERKSRRRLGSAGKRALGRASLGDYKGNLGELSLEQLKQLLAQARQLVVKPDLDKKFLGQYGTLAGEVVRKRVIEEKNLTPLSALGIVMETVETERLQRHRLHGYYEGRAIDDYFDEGEVEVGIVRAIWRRQNPVIVELEGLPKVAAATTSMATQWEVARIESPIQLGGEPWRSSGSPL